MKTLKITLVATVMACAMTSLAFTGGIKEKPSNRPVAMPVMQKVISIDFQRALANPALVIAMYRQVTREDLLHSPGHILVIDVVLDGKVYRIRGTIDQWYKFFMRGGIGPVRRDGCTAVD